MPRVAPDALRESLRAFRSFNARAPHRLDRIRLNLDRPLVRVGEVPELHYMSDKEGRPTHYYHRVRRPGVMYADPRGGLFVIVGGSTRIRGRWLRENPPRRLSRSNLVRAIRAFEGLTPKQQKRVDDEVRWVLGTAWKIQRVRVRRRGTR